MKPLLDSFPDAWAIVIKPNNVNVAVTCVGTNFNHVFFNETWEAANERIK